MRSPTLNPATTPADVSAAAACVASVALVALVALGTAPVRAQILTPSPYVRASDSPFNSVSFVYFHRETFEDGALNTPGISTVGGTVAAPGAFTDSVDEDDGSVDGSGTGGRSFYSNGLNGFTFTFNAVTLGALPTHAGIVWTDVGSVTPLSVVFEAFGPGGVSLGTVSQNLSDGQANGGTAEDRFFGAINAAGISAIRLSMPNSTDWEMDHVQYGLANASAVAPEPSALALLALPLAGMVIRKRRKA
jgi:hypothetical protein